MCLEEKDYYLITEKLKGIAHKYCGDKLVSVLEGGYHIPSLKRCAREHVVSLITK
jgi:acetoin utilization deacetylase AcuC-like enzyme